MLPSKSPSCGGLFCHCLYRRQPEKAPPVGADQAISTTGKRIAEEVRRLTD
jgi:hypothetical protein